ncbi:MAG: Rrf2 family transcriptional regulator [Oscillospiraceae bacterium]|nr:Rrf2 family transcriptional regulator [Oscillospiraceae bacterium]
MHITLEADYAVRIVGCLARSGSRMDAKTISNETEVTLRFALKILRKLVASGIVKSFKGTQGGYELAKNSRDISLKDVIETVEGKYHLSRCLSSEYTCSREESGQCKVRCVFDKISAEVEKKLEEYTFDMFE